MTEPWIGRCHVQARTTEQQRWIGDREAAFGRLILTASSLEDFEAGLRHALSSMGYDLVAVISATPVAQADDLGAFADRLPSLLPYVGRVRPVPLGGFTEAKSKSAWGETSWEALLAQKTPLWALIDGVNWPEISKLLGQGNAEHSCLYSTLNPQSRALAPWLVRLAPDHPITAVIRKRPQDSHSLILLQSNHTISEIRHHLRHFTMLQTPANAQAPVYFRFYDPRVMIDVLASMSEGFLSGFTHMFSQVVAPLSPLCLLPDRIALTGPTIDLFENPQNCQGRLLSWLRPEDWHSVRTGRPVVSVSEFSALSDRMELRATRKLARQLHEVYGDLTSAKRCLRIAMGARRAAADFGMTSVKQVRIIARSQLLFGEEFGHRYPEAGRILASPSLQAWQKEDQLMAWFDAMYRNRRAKAEDRKAV